MRIICKVYDLQSLWFHTMMICKVYDVDAHSESTSYTLQIIILWMRMPSNLDLYNKNSF